MIETKLLLWLVAVSVIGSVVGFIHKTNPKVETKTLKKKAYLLLTSILTSLFLSYIVYEVLRYTIQSDRLCIAIAGFCAYLGIDLLVVLQDKLINKLKDKIDDI